MSSTINNPSIPYVGSLPQPLQQSHIIRIQGNVNHSAVCFSVNLQCGVNTLPRHDTALHLSPVFSPPPRLVRNSIQNGQWGPEESHGPPFPFFAGQNFEILILAEANEYKIAVNGQHFAEFNHRLPLYAVSHLAIDGDVTIHVLKFESSQSAQHGSSDITMPIGFVNPSASVPDFGSGRPPSPYGDSNLPYPTGNATFGPQPSSNPYEATSPSYPYGPPASSNPYPGSNPYPSSNPYPGSNPYPSSNPYGPPPGSPYGGSSPSHPYGPAPVNNPYGPPPGGYPSQTGGSGYPSQSGPYPGTTVVYPGQEKDKTSSSGLSSGLTALGTALAGGVGGAMLGGKHKHKKHGHSLNPTSALMAGAPMLAGGLLGKGAHKSSGSSGKIGGVPIGGAVAGGAAALAGAYMLSKSPIGKVMKPKKMKKLYKHKHKLKHGFGGFYSSSSSSSSEEE